MASTVTMIISQIETPEQKRGMKRVVRYGNGLPDAGQILTRLVSTGGWDDMVVIRNRYDDALLDSVVGITVKAAMGDREEVRDVRGRTIRRWWWDEECEVTVLHLEKW